MEGEGVLDGAPGCPAGVCVSAGNLLALCASIFACFLRLSGSPRVIWETGERWPREGPGSERRDRTPQLPPAPEAPSAVDGARRKAEHGDPPHVRLETAAVGDPRG